MGATTYTVNAKGTNVRDLFDKLVQEAQDYHGYDSYNGSISTTDLSKEIHLPKKVTKSVSKINDFINDFDNDDLLYPKKWETTYANLGISHYEAYTSKWVDDLQTPKRKNGVRTIQSFSITKKGERVTLREFKTLSEAKKIAKEHSIRIDESITVHKHRSDGSRFVLGHFELTSDGKEYKSARKTTKTKIYKPVNEYIFFVYGAC